MESLDNFVKNTLDSIGRPQFIRYVMIYMLVIGVLTLCGGIALFVAGGLAGIAGVGSVAVGSQTGASSSDLQNQGAAVAAVGGIALVYGLLNIVIGPAMVVVGLGLRNRAKWSRMGVVVVGGIGVLASLLGLITGSGNVIGIISLIVDALVVYAFYRDPGIISEFEKPAST